MGDLEALEKARAEVEKLSQRVKELPQAVEALANEWLGSNEVLKNVAISKANQQRMMELAQKRAKQKNSKSASDSDNTTWNAASALKALGDLSGIVKSAELKEAFKTPNASIIAKRLLVVAGDVLDAEGNAIAIGPQHTLNGAKGTRYRFNIDKVRTRLEQAVAAPGDRP